jgi:hypothetical protein
MADTNIRPIDPAIELQIANMFLIWQTEEQIAEQLNIPIVQVKRTLASDATQKYLDRTSSNTEMQLHLRRIRRAGELLDPLLDRIEDLINDNEFPITKRKDSHVALMKDVLLNKLPSTIAKTIGLAIQMNFGNKKEMDTAHPELESILNKLEPGQVLLFRDLVDKLWQIFLRGMVWTLNELTKILDASLSD